MSELIVILDPFSGDRWEFEWPADIGGESG